MEKKINVGDELYCVPTQRRGTPFKLKITHVGRKFAYGSHYRDKDTKISIETFSVDNGEYSPYISVYQNEEVYKLNLKISEQWTRLRVGVGYSAPKDISLHNIQEAMRLLGIE